MHYPAISKIVEDEALKRGLQYAKYDTLPQIISRFTRYDAPPPSSSTSLGSTLRCSHCVVTLF